MRIERIVTRPDFDGVVCASLSKDIYGPDIPILWLEPEEVSLESDLIKEGDIIANLPYSNNCSMYFDHHVTNNPPPDKPGLFSFDPSASGLIYNYFNGQFSRDFSELVYQTDRIDSADLTKDEILFPENYPYLLISMSLQSTKGDDEDYWNLLTNLLREKNIDQVFNNVVVKQRTDEFLKSNKNFKDILIKHTRIFKNIALTDFRNVPHVISSNRFLVYAVFPDIDISIKALKTKKDKSTIHISVAYNIFRADKRINIGKFLKQYGGGGHPTAGGISVDVSSFQVFVQKIINQISLQYKS